MMYLYSTLVGFKKIGSDIQIGQICSVVCIRTARAGSQSQNVPTTATDSPHTVRSQCTQNMKLFLCCSSLSLRSMLLLLGSPSCRVPSCLQMAWPFSLATP